MIKSTVRLVNDVGEVTELDYLLPPKEAITCAVYQFVFKDWKTWKYEYNIPLIERGDRYVYLFGENSMLWVRKGDK